VPEARLDAPKLARVDDLSISSDARRARFSNFAAPFRQILAGITAHVIGAPIARVFTWPRQQSKDLDDIQPAGDYLLDTDEELIEGLSRLAYRRVATLLHLPSTSRPQNRTEVLSVSPAELDAVLESDRIVRA
jgi:hypothetical protein